MCLATACPVRAGLAATGVAAQVTMIASSSAPTGNVITRVTLPPDPTGAKAVTVAKPGRLTAIT